MFLDMHKIVNWAFLINILWARVSDSSNPILMDDLNCESHLVVRGGGFL